jgi:hypothetical protein
MDAQEVILGFIGTGGRGQNLLQQIVSMEDVRVSAVCDLNPKNHDRVRSLMEAQGRSVPDFYDEYDALLDRNDIQGVLICTGWKSHLKISMAAMRKGIFAAPEVGPANSIEECLELVRTHERTGAHCMMLENYCFARDIMTVLRMAREGIFGELLHCEAGYQHELMERMVLGKGTGILEKGMGDYRTTQSLKRNADVYPTHGLGPLAKVLKINRGNRFLKLSSTASKARGLAQWSEDNLPPDHPAAHKHWARGDVVTSILTCAGGETVILKLITTIPTPMSRLGRIHGTRGVWVQESERIYIEGRSPAHTWEEFDKYENEYEHPLWKTYREKGIRGGHWGADFILLRLMVESIRSGDPPPIDTYDTATWMAVGALSENSISLGGSPVPFPDFTSGEWIDGDAQILKIFDREYDF